MTNLILYKSFLTLSMNYHNKINAKEWICGLIVSNNFSNKSNGKCSAETDIWLWVFLEKMSKQLLYYSIQPAAFLLKNSPKHAAIHLRDIVM